MASSLRALVNDFKQQLKIPNNVVMWISKERKFVIIAYYLEKDISVKKELNYSNLLYKYHGLNWMKLDPLKIPEIISINKNYSSILVFTSRKQQKVVGSPNENF